MKRRDRSRRRKSSHKKRRSGKAGSRRPTTTSNRVQRDRRRPVDDDGNDVLDITADDSQCAAERREDEQGGDIRLKAASFNDEPVLADGNNPVDVLPLRTPVRAHASSSSPMRRSPHGSRRSGRGVLGSSTRKLPAHSDDEIISSRAKSVGASQRAKDFVPSQISRGITTGESPGCSARCCSTRRSKARAPPEPGPAASRVSQSCL